MVEGQRELEHCLEGGFQVRTVFVCPEILKGEAEAICGAIPFAVKPAIIEIPEAIYRKVAYRDSTEGIIAEVEYKARSLNDLQLPENHLVVVLESVEKPGNLGAVLRSADAAGADAVLIGDPLTDL